MRGTLQPVRAGRKSAPGLFAPSRTPIEPIAPASIAPYSVADSTMEGTARPPMEEKIGSSRAIDGEACEESSSFSVAASSVSSSSTPTSDASSSSIEESTRKSLVYSLQDENADLRKEIQSLEIVLRDHGFSKDGKQIVPNDEIVRIDQDNDEDGHQRAHMEMVSMMGMDPERPTVLTKYMEFKINELEDDLEKMEYDRDRFAMMVKNLTAEATAKETIMTEHLKDSKSHKRMLEEKLTNAISKTRENFLSEKVGDLESDLNDFHRAEDVLRERISELEHLLEEQQEEIAAHKHLAQAKQDLLAENQELTVIVETQAKKETLLKEQITALETNLEWNIEEATKREKLLRGQITALETSLEWNIDNSSRREDNLRAKINELETSNRDNPEENDQESHSGSESDSADDGDDEHGESNDVSDENEGSTLDDTFTIEPSTIGETATLERLTDTNRSEDEEDGTLTPGENSLTQADLLNISAYLKTTQTSATPAPFEQSISEISKYHNERLEQWKREESKEREEQLISQIAALETNLEWNMKESKKQEISFQEQIAALETNLEWNIEESTKRETLLQERITELENRREEDSMTIDTLIPPDDFLEMKQQLEKIKVQKQKLEDWLSKVVEESTKREKNLQQIIRGLESTSKGFEEREEILISRVAELETQTEELEAEKEILVSRVAEQETLAEEMEAERASVEKEEILISRIAELEQQNEELKAEKQKQGNLESFYEAALEKEFKKQERMTGEIDELQNTLKTDKELHENQVDDLLIRLSNLTEALDEEMSKRKSPTKDSSEQLRSTGVEQNDAEKEILSNRVKELEKELESLKKNENSGSSDSNLKAELEKAMRKTDEAKSRIFELENELASYRKEKFDRNKKMAKLQGDMEAIAQKNEGLSETIMELESDLEYERQEKLDSDKRIAKLQGDLENLTIQQAPITAINERLEQEAEDLRKNENTASRRVIELENELESYRKEKFDRNKKMAKIQTDMEAIAQKNEGLSETVMELESDLEHERKEKFDRTKRIAELESELEHTIQHAPISPVVTGAKSIQEIRSPNSQRIFDLENQLATYRKEKFDRNKKMAKIQTDMEAIAQKNEGLLETIMELESDLEYEQQEKSDRNKRIAELQSDLENAKIDLENAKVKQAPISSLNAHLEKEAEEYEMERNSLIQTLEKLQHDFNANAKMLKSLKSYSHNLELEHEALKIDHGRLKQRIQVLTEEGIYPRSPKSPKSPKAKNFKSSESSIQNFLQAELKMAKSEQERLHKSNVDLLKDLMESKSNSKAEQARLQESNEDLIHQLKESKSNSNAEQERLYKRIEELTAKLEESKLNPEVEEERKRLQKSYEDLTDQLEETKSKSSAEQERLQKYIEELTVLTVQLEGSKSSFNTEQEYERLQKSNEDLTHQLEETKAKSNVERERLSKSIDELTAKLLESTSKAKIEQERFNTRIKELTKELEDSVSEEPEELEESVSKATENGPEPERTEAKRHNPKTLKKLRNKIVLELKNELVNRERATELATLKEEFVETAIKHKTKEEELSARAQALETELEFFQHEHERMERIIRVLRNELKMAADINEDVVARSKELEKDLVVARSKELYKQMEAQKTEKESFMKEVDDLKIELENTRKTLHNNILDLKMKLKSKQSEFEHLNEFKHELEAELDETTKKVRNIEMEFETAAKTMDTTYEELSSRNNMIEKELVSYKSENEYLSKFVEELQNDLAKKNSGKRSPEPMQKTLSLKSIDSTKSLKSIDSNKSLKSIDSTKKLSEKNGDDELIESEHLNTNLNDELIDTDNESNNEDANEEIQLSGKTDSDIDASSSSSSSSSSTASKERQRKRLTSEISEIEEKLKDVKSTRESLSKSIGDMEEEKAKMKLDDSARSTSTLTSQIRESEAELEVINAQIYELEADLEDLLDELWDFDRDQEDSDIEEQDQDKRMGSVYYTPKNREHLSSRVVELEREMEELEDELEETIEKSKSQRQTLVVQNADLEKKLEAATEKAMKEKQAFHYRTSELEKELEETIEKSRKDQQALAIHYIEKERELKETSRRANAEERRLKSQISKLEKMIDSFQDGAKTEEAQDEEVNKEETKKDEFLFSSLSILMEDIDNSNGSEEENNSKENVESQNTQLDKTEDPQRRAQECLIAKVSELKEQYNTKVTENKVLNEIVLEFEAKLQTARETVERAEKENQDLTTKFDTLETKWKRSDEDHETAIWEAEQKMRDLIDTASLERKEKKRFQDEGKTMKKDLETLQKEIEELNAQSKSLERTVSAMESERESLDERNVELEKDIKSASTKHEAEKKQIMNLIKEAQTERESLVQRNAELEKDIESASTKHEAEKKQIMNHMKNLKKQLVVSTDKITNLSAQIALHEAEKEKHAELAKRFSELEKELQLAVEKAKEERQLHMNLKKRLVEITMKNQAERANLDNRVHKLEKELKSTRMQNESLSMDLKFFEEQKNQLNLSGVDLEDELRSTFAENDKIFDKIQSYERGASQDRTVTETTTYCDEDTLTSDRESLNGSPKGEGGMQEELDSRGNDSNDNSTSTARRTNGGLASAPFLDELNGIMDAQPKRKQIEDYLSPLVEKADKVLGQQIPVTIVRGVQHAMVLRAQEVTNENFSWEDFESILEEVCKDFDQDTWFDIQEAFFVAWEEIEIEQMAEDDGHDVIYNQ